MARDDIDMLRPIIEGFGFGLPTVEERRAALAAVTSDVPAPPGTTATLTDIGGRPAEWLEPSDSDDRVVLYLHGGAYVSGGLDSHRDLAGRIAAAYGGRVLTLDYRLAPEHPFPAALDDAVSAYDELVDSGISPNAIALAGDSAGGGLVTATLVSLRDRGWELPACAVLLSPWADLTLTSDTHESRAETDFFLQRDTLLDSASHYLGDTPATDPLASPVFADLSGLPPLLIHVGDREVLLRDALTLAERATADGVDATLRAFDEMIHVFQTLPPELIPESGIALGEICSFIDHHLP